MQLYHMELRRSAVMTGRRLGHALERDTRSCIYYCTKKLR